MPTETSPACQRSLLLLWGFMAVGKSTVAHELGRRLALPSIDLDERISAAEGCSISEIFRRDGEAGFRALEQRALGQLMDAQDAQDAQDAHGARQPQIVALGGGTLLHAPSRERALNEAFVVVLQAAPATVAARLHSDARPLLADPSKALERILALLDARRAAYAEAHLQLDTEGHTVAEIAERICSAWQPDPSVLPPT